jgi:predicted permease
MGGLTLALMAVATLVAKALKADDDERISLILASSMINVGNFGLPLIYFTYGNAASAVAILYFVAFNIPLGTTAIYLTSRERSIGPIVKDIMKIPIFHALVLAVIMSQFRIPVPAVIEKSLELMGQAAIPLLIFVLGLQLANIRFERRFIKFIVPSVLIRLVLSPLIALALFHFLGVSGFERNVAVVQTSAPAAILPLMYAIRFNRAPDLLAATILATTLLSGLSLTVLIHYLPYIP